jgi:nitrogen fixation NifU-like protein
MVYGEHGSFSAMDFTDLYQEIIMDHYRRPRGAAVLDHVPESKVHENPSCGDSIKVEVLEKPEGTVEKVRFEARGCAISTASASLMSGLLTGKTAGEARRLANSFIQVMRGEEKAELLDGWGELACLKGIIRYPVRVKCATLAWHALLDALPEETEAGLDEDQGY